MNSLPINSFTLPTDNTFCLKGGSELVRSALKISINFSIFLSR